MNDCFDSRFGDLHLSNSEISTQCNVQDDLVMIKKGLFPQYEYVCFLNAYFSYAPTCLAHNADTGSQGSSPRLLCTLSDLTEEEMREK